MLPDWEIVMLKPSSDLRSVIEAASAAKILIGSNISDLIHHVWMAANRTAVIDLSGNHWLNTTARHMEVRYYPMNDEERTPGEMQLPNSADGDKFKAVLKEAVEFVESYVEPDKEVVQYDLNMGWAGHFHPLIK